MLLELQGAVNSRQTDLLGYSRHSKKPVVASVSVAPGQFDDADDGGDEDPAAHGGGGCGMPPRTDNQTSAPRQQHFQRNEVSPEQHPLQWLVEAACDRTQHQTSTSGRTPRTPRRVSLSNDHPQDRIHSAGETKKADQEDFTAAATAARRISMDSEKFDGVRVGKPATISRVSSISSVATSQTYQALEEQLGAGSKQVSKFFDEQYRELLEFRKLHGHTDVLTRGEHKGLGSWLSSLRCTFRSGELPADHAKLLRDLGCIGFDDLQCENRPMIPKLYSTTVPASTVSEGTSKESSTDSADANKDKENTFTLQKGELPPPLGGKSAVQHNFKRSIMQPHGSFHHPGPRMPFVPLGSIPTNHQVQVVPFAPSRMPVDPSVQEDNDDWYFGVKQLEDFSKEYGHVNVSTTLVATNKKEHHQLSLWLASKRHLHRKGQLPRERAHVLHSYFGCAGFDPGSAPAKPSAPPAAGASFPPHPFAARSIPHVRPDAPGFVSTGVRAVHPAFHRRVMPHQKGTLHSAEAIHAKVYVQQPQVNPNTGKPIRKRGQYIGWHDRLEQLIAFRKKNGHADVRIMMHDDCKELGRWLASQRHQFRKDKLPKDKIEILQRLGVNLAYKKPPALGSY